MANPRRSSYASNSENPFQVQTFSMLSSLKHFLKKPHALPFLLSIFLFLAWVCVRLQHSSHPSSSVNLRGVQERKWSKEDDEAANLARFPSGSAPSPIVKDKRGWLLNPVSLVLDSGIQGVLYLLRIFWVANLARFPSEPATSNIVKDESGWLPNPVSLVLDSGIQGGAVSCASIHVGEIRPGAVRGNHRHHNCNETFVIWGAKTLFRLENNKIVDKGYVEVTVGADEVAVAASPSGTAHVLVNVDPIHTSYFIGCQDRVIDYSSSTTDFSVWKDI